MDAYTINIITGIIRVLIFLFILFIILPRLLFGRVGQIKFPDKMFAGIILLSSSIIVMVYLLSLVRIYDSISLMFSISVFSGVFVLVGERGKDGDISSKLNIHGLRVLEQNIIGRLRETFSKGSRYISGRREEYAIIWKVMLVLILAVSGFERLFPAFKIASPFSIEAYQNLEYVKALETRNLFYDQIFIPKGMHVMIDIIFQFTRVNPQTLVHIFGAITALILVWLLYSIVYRVTGNRPAALIAAAIFGMFPGVLPLSLESQVEANSIVPNSIFIVLSIYFMIEFINKPSLNTFVISVMGIIGAILISFFAIIIFILVIPIFALANFLVNRKLGINFLQRSFSGLVFLISLAGLYFAHRELCTNPLAMATIKSIVMDDSFIRFAHEKMIFEKEVFFFGAIALGMVSLLFSKLMKETRLQMHYLIWGLTTIALAAFWYADELGQVFELNKTQAAFVLAVFVCINLGLVLYCIVFRLIEMRAVKEEIIPLRVTVAGLIIVLILFEGLLFLNAPAIAKFQYQTEPDGYVRAIYEIEKTNDPYDWMVVSHFGAEVQVQGYGRFMDYIYFLKYYSPEKFNQQAAGVIPVKYLYIFAEKDVLNSSVDTAFLPKISGLNKKINSWCESFARENENYTIFYEDDQVRVFQIVLPKKKKTISDMIG